MLYQETESHFNQNAKLSVSFHTIKHIVLYISDLGWLAWVCLGFCEM